MSNTVRRADGLVPKIASVPQLQIGLGVYYTMLVNGLLLRRYVVATWYMLGRRGCGAGVPDQAWCVVSLANSLLGFDGLGLTHPRMEYYVVGCVRLGSIATGGVGLGNQATSLYNTTLNTYCQKVYRCWRLCTILYTFRPQMLASRLHYKL